MIMSNVRYSFSPASLSNPLYWMICHLRSRITSTIRNHQPAACTILSNCCELGIALAKHSLSPLFWWLLKYFSVWPRISKFVWDDYYSIESFNSAPDILRGILCRSLTLTARACQVAGSSSKIQEYSKSTFCFDRDSHVNPLQQLITNRIPLFEYHIYLCPQLFSSIRRIFLSQTSSFLALFYGFLAGHKCRPCARDMLCPVSSLEFHVLHITCSSLHVRCRTKTQQSESNTIYLSALCPPQNLRTKSLPAVSQSPS